MDDEYKFAQRDGYHGIHCKGCRKNRKQWRRRGEMKRLCRRLARRRIRQKESNHSMTEDITEV